MKACQQMFDILIGYKFNVHVAISIYPNFTHSKLTQNSSVAVNFTKEYYTQILCRIGCSNNNNTNGNNNDDDDDDGNTYNNINVGGTH